MSLWSILLIALTATGCGFAVLYFVARHIDNYGIVDVAWAAGFSPVAVFYAAFGSGALERRLLIASMTMLWSLRLGLHLGRRVLGHHPVEDGRYQQLRKDWSGNFAVKMFQFFQFQALVLVALSVPALLTVNNPAAQLQPLEIAGILLFLFALAGETLADRQLIAFKRDSANKGRVCDQGLWHYSRHPNYFFEWLVWVAFSLFALASPWGWLALYCPAMILFFLLKVTGIGYTENQLLRSKGDAYRAYQQKTSAFVPWPNFNRPA